MSAVPECPAAHMRRWEASRYTWEAILQNGDRTGNKGWNLASQLCLTCPTRKMNFRRAFLIRGIVYLVKGKSSI